MTNLSSTLNRMYYRYYSVLTKKLSNYIKVALQQTRLV